jgi:hypothetical protein
VGLKLFSKSKPISLYDMRRAEPGRATPDFSDPAYQAKANERAGYKPVGASDLPADGTLYIFSEGGKRYRAQNGTLWEKQ